MDLGSDASAFTLQGDLFDTDSEIFADNGENGHNILARWIRQLGGESSLQLQAYYDDLEREFPLVRDALETFDVQGQYSGSAGRHRFVVGGGVRTTRDEFVNDLNTFVLVTERKRLWVMNIIAKDEMQHGDDMALTAEIGRAHV